MEITKEQVFAAMKEHGTPQKAAVALDIKYAQMQKYLRKYGITAEMIAKARQPWYKRIFQK